jgi:hypothetical protein
MAIPVAAALTLSTGLFTGGLSAAGTGLRAFSGLVKVATIAVAGLATGLALVTARQIAFVDRLGKISDTVGLTTDLIQKFGFAAEIAGVSFDQSSVALRRFSRRLGEAKKGVGELRPALREIGLKDAEIKAMSAEQALMALADGIANTEDESKRLALAFKAFDSEGAELVNALKNGSEGLKEMFKEMEKLGILLSRDSIRQVEDLQDSLTTLSTATFGAANALLVSLAPALERVVTGLTETITAEVEARGGFQEFGQFLKEEFLGLLQKTITGIVGIYNAFAILINGIMDSAAAIGIINNDIHSLKKNLAEFKEIEGNGFLENFFDLSNWQMSAGRAGDILEKELGSGFLLTKDNVSKAIAILERELTKAENEGKVGLNLPLIDAEDITGALTFLEDLKGKSTEAATNVAEVITTGTQGTLHFLDAALNKVFGVDRVDKFFSETEEYAEKAVLSIGDFIKITFEMMGEDMKTFFEGIAEAVRNSGLGDATKTLAEGFIKAGQLLEQSLTDAVLTGKASFSDLADHIKQVLAKALIQKFITGPLLAMIPGLASGGPATAGKPYVVGEEGPELFVPTASGTVIPNDEMTSGGSGMGGATNVTYNIQATDAASFKSLVARDPEFIYNVSRAGQRRQPA